MPRQRPSFLAWLKKFYYNLAPTASSGFSSFSVCTISAHSPCWWHAVHTFKPCFATQLQYPLSYLLTDFLSFFKTGLRYHLQYDVFSHLPSRQQLASMSTLILTPDTLPTLNHGYSRFRLESSLCHLLAWWHWSSPLYCLLVFWSII